MPGEPPMLRGRPHGQKGSHAGLGHTQVPSRAHPPPRRACTGCPRADPCVTRSTSCCVSGYRQWPQTLRKIRGWLSATSWAAFLYIAPPPNTLAYGTRGFNTLHRRGDPLPGGWESALGRGSEWKAVSREPGESISRHRGPLLLALHRGSAPPSCPRPSARGRPLCLTP